jgi:hypothetical protein
MLGVYLLQIYRTHLDPDWWFFIDFSFTSMPLRDLG